MNPRHPQRPARTHAHGQAATAGSDAVFIDDSVILACTLAEALSCLRDADAIASWFDARRGPTHTTLRASGRQLVLARRHVDWRPENGVLLIAAIAGPVRINTHLTLLIPTRRSRVRQSQWLAISATSRVTR